MRKYIENSVQIRNGIAEHSVLEKFNIYGVPLGTLTCESEANVNGLQRREDFRVLT